MYRGVAFRRIIVTFPLVALIAGACSAKTAAGGGGQGTSGSFGPVTSASGDSGADVTAGAGGFDPGGGNTTATSGAGGSCAEVKAKAENTVQPADIIVAIDQSGSMNQETVWVKDQLGPFSKQIVGAGIDVHVALIAGKPGFGNGFCVPAPLGSGGCPADDNPPSLLHLNQPVDSHNALQLILGGYPAYKQVLRPQAQKHLVVISDDEAGIKAPQFDQLLLASDPSFKGYHFHAIVAAQQVSIAGCLIKPNPCCLTAAAEGKQYEQLVAASGGVLGDLCLQNFQPVWDAVSKKVIASAKLACAWDVPKPPQNQMFDPGAVNVDYATDGNAPAALGHVASAGDCAKVVGGWYYDDPASPKQILACPQTCELLQKAAKAEVEIKFGCASVPATPK